MLRNYLKVAIRNLKRNKVFSLINIIGLSIGLTAVLLISLNIRYEHSFNSFNKNEDRIYRVDLTLKVKGKALMSSPEFVAALGPSMLKDMPEVENYVRIATPRTKYFTYGNKSIKIEDVTYADSSLFNIFSFTLVTGNKRTALTQPNSIVLTQSTATKIFGREDPVGKMITIQGASYMVTGVTEDPPSNSDVRFSSVISFSSLYNKPNIYLGWDGGNQYITYVLLNKNSSMEQVNKKFPDFLWSYINKRYSTGGWKEEARLEPLKGIHLYYNPDSATIRGNIKTYLAIAFFILLIACANFVNLSTARATSRMREVGMRKVLGANRNSLVFQFLSESVLLSLLALLIALVLVKLLMPWYIELTGKHIVLSQFMDGSFIIFLLGVLVFTGIVAGSYPALFLSSFRPTSILKGKFTTSGHGLSLRKALVILQFAISIVLIVSTFVINGQLGFMRNKDLGFDHKNIMVIPLVNNNLRTKFDSFKTELKRIPGVEDAAASSEVPLNDFTSNGYQPEGYKSPLIIKVVACDEDFLQTYGIRLVKGRQFGDQMGPDKNAYLVNEALSKQLGWNDPVGKKIDRNGSHTVIGEVKNFNYASLYYPIEPLIITNNPESGSFNYVSIRLRRMDTPDVLARIKKIWHDFAPMIPFEYRILDQEFTNIYQSEISFRETFLVFSWLAIFVALLGLIGLVSYSVEVKRREIGIRKVLGSSVREIVTLLSKDYLKWVILANIIGWPVAYLIMHKWLENFAYRTKMHMWVFVAASGIVAAAALLTTSLQAIKAARTNPVESLRNE